MTKVLIVEPDTEKELFESCIDKINKDLDTNFLITYETKIPEQLINGCFSFAIMDYSKNDDSIEYAKKLRGCGNNTFILFLSNDYEAKKRWENDKIHNTMWVEKPYRYTKLREIISKIITR